MQQSRHIQAGGTRLHIVEEGKGPLVILVHGFPELWYSWRFQIPAIAKMGYRVVALDQRGYGSSSKYWNPDAYRLRPLVADLVALVKALGEEQAILIGHDWGAPVVWTAAWQHPEIFRGVLGMSVPFSGRGQIALPGNPFGDMPPHEIHEKISGPGADFYQIYFGALEGIIDEIEVDLRSWVRDLMWTVSGDAASAAGINLKDTDPVQWTRDGALCLPHGQKMRERFAAPDVMPAWLTDDDLDVFVDALRGGGFAGPLSFYRNLENNWHDLAHMVGKPLTVPAVFLGAEYDVATWWGAESIARAPEVMTNWMGAHVIDGAGHWLQQEKPDDTNRVIGQFLAALK